MKKRDYFICVLFFVVGISAFACPHLVEKDGRGKLCEVARVFMDDTLGEVVNGETVYGKPVRGVVYFEGFDFKGYGAESKGLEPMLDETYVLLKEYYAAENQPDGKPVPFVFLGHSQGGLRALAMSTYLKDKDPVLYKQLKGVVTFSGIDKGLKLLENRGANFRSEVYAGVHILVNGVHATVKVLDFTPYESFLDSIVDKLLGTSLEECTNTIINLVLCKWVGATKGFAYPIMNNDKWDQYAQIRDMCPQSDFVKKYVLEEKPYYYKVATGTKVVIIWNRGWLGIPYPTLARQTVYSTVKTTDVNMKVDKDLPLDFVIGTQNDTLSVAPDKVRKDIDKGMNIAGDVFTGAKAAHIAKCVFIIGLFTNSPVCASDCAKAAAWCYGYKNQINEALGEISNDGLVAASYQQLPAYSRVGASCQTKVLNKSNRVFYSRNHFDISNIGTESRNKINDYADEFLGIKNRSNKKR